MLSVSLNKTFLSLSVGCVAPDAGQPVPDGGHADVDQGLAARRRVHPAQPKGLRVEPAHQGRAQGLGRPVRVSDHVHEEKHAHCAAQRHR